MEENRVFTLEEFTEEVKRQFVEMMPELTPKQVDEYFEGEEANRVIREQYSYSINKYKNGKNTVIQVNVGGTSAAANCLYYCY